MLAKSRSAALGTAALLTASVLLSVLAPTAAATAGRDSPAAAYDGSLGPFLGYFDFSVFVAPGPPVVEDWYKFNVVAGQMFQVSLWIETGGSVTVYHQNPTDPNAQMGFDRAGNDVGCGIGLATRDILITTTELIYIKVSPSGTGADTQYYNLAMRAFTPSVVEGGASFSPPPGENSIHGWAIPNFIGNPNNCQIYLPERFTSDYYWVNASDITGPNHRTYRVQLTQTCQTAMFDLYLYQTLDPARGMLDLLNHSLSMQRRLNRLALTTNPNTIEFAPVQYDGYYLLQVLAIENGSWSVSTTDRYSYTVSVSTLGGVSKDGNDRRGEGPVLTLSGHVLGRIDGRDDSVDWFSFALLQNDLADISVSFTRPNNEISTMGVRYRAIVYDPNGTIIQDIVNFAQAGPGVFFYPYITIPTITAQLNGTYVLQLAAIGSSLNTGAQIRDSGGVSRNWADYDANFVLPNRKPVLNGTRPLVADLSPFAEDTSTTTNLFGWFVDPDGKLGFPQYVVDPAYATNPGVNFTFTMAGYGLTINPKPDWNGNELVPVLVKDDVPSNTVKAYLNVTVFAVNDAPRIYSTASNAWSVLSLPEDSSSTVTLREIFYDVDDASLNFTVSGTSGGHLNVTINKASQVATVTPDPNWNSQQTVTWNAVDAEQETTTFDTIVSVTGLNDPPRATDTKLERVIFEEGDQQYLNLSGHFFDVDGEPLRYYSEILDPVAAQYIRINNSDLRTTDPYMRIYVLDRARADYFTPGAVQVKFYVVDGSDNCDPTLYCPEVSKTTFIDIINVNDAPIVDEVTPTGEEVATTDYFEGDNITFSVTQVTDPDNTYYPTDLQFFFKWFVNGEEVAGESGPTFVFKTVLDATRLGQYDEGNYTVSVQIYDAAGAKAVLEPEWQFQILKSNRAPTVQIIRPTLPLFDEGAQIDFQALASDEDPEDDPTLQITWTYTDMAGKVHSLGSGDRVRQLLEPGNYTVTVRVSDGFTTVERSVPVAVRAHTFNTPGFDLGPALVAMILAAAAAAGLATRRAGRRP